MHVRIHVTIILEEDQSRKPSQPTLFRAFSDILGCFAGVLFQKSKTEIFWYSLNVFHVPYCAKETVAKDAHSFHLMMINQKA